MVDRLEKWELSNCGIYPFCKQVTEMVDHIFIVCRYFARLWRRVKDWLGILELVSS
jgi:hypothetical protein